MVVDDASTDQTSSVLAGITGIKVVSNPKNMGFIASCNLGAAIAKGKFLIFLNNDTQILSGWLENLLLTVENDNSIGIVGSKLIYPDGSLQEAGGVVWQDGGAWNYGRYSDRLEDANAPAYNYTRAVDYCSAASLLIRAELFEQVGGFSELFAPAYYEDTDLCFAVRKLGYQVIYQPQSVVIHYEGITAGVSTTSGIKQNQKVNQQKFVLKWHTELSQHFSTSNPNHGELAPRRLLGKITILLIDSYVPRHDRESGSHRLYAIAKMLSNLGYRLIFLPDDGNPETPYITDLQNLGIEVLYPSQNSDLPTELGQRLDWIDAAWICRPELCQKYFAIMKQNPKIKLIYDTIDLHFVRAKREWQLSNQKQSSNWQEIQTQELSLAKSANLTIAITPDEQQILQTNGVRNVQIIPNLHQLYAGDRPEFNERKGILFIGSYSHPPNIDAVQWLCQEIMPLIWRVAPEIQLTLLGSSPTKEVQKLASDRIFVPGFRADVTPFFLSHRVFLAPLRYGAGMKGKVGQSLAFGLPVVTTAIGAEGMGLSHGKNILIGDRPENLAAETLKLYQNQALWQEMSNQAIAAMLPFTQNQIQPQLAQLIQNLLGD